MMKGHKRDWLDGIAVRCVGGDVPGAEIARSAEVPSRSADDARFSRAATVKLAVAGVASLSLGMWKAPPALAQDRGECFAKCLDGHDKELKQRLRSCDDVVGPGLRKKWSQLATLFPPLAQIVIARAALTGLCYAEAQSAVAGDKNDCYEGCERKCRQRSTQSVSRTSRSTCEVTPPTRGEHPSVPPPPTPPTGEIGYCAPGGACDQVGGKCCGEPTGIPGINVCLDKSLCP